MKLAKDLFLMEKGCYLIQIQEILFIKEVLKMDCFRVVEFYTYTKISIITLESFNKVDVMVGVGLITKMRSYLKDNLYATIFTKILLIKTKTITL